MQQEGVALAIEVSRFQEDPTPALKSAFACGLEEIHLVCHGNVPLDPQYANRVTIHPTGDLDLRLVRAFALIRVQGDVAFNGAAIQKMKEDMQRHAHSSENYAISSGTVLDQPSFFEMFYGYLIVLLIFDTLRSIATLFQYQRSSDLRGSFIHRTFNNNVYESKPRRFMWWMFTNTYRTRRMDECCAQIPSGQDQGLVFLWRTISTHRNMSLYPWSFWWVGFALYYYVFSIVFISFSFFWLCVYGVHMLFVAYITQQHLRLPHDWMLILQVISYPLYLTTFPVIFLFFRLLPSRVFQKPKEGQ